MVVVFENHDYEEIIGSDQAPFLNGLAAGSVSLTGMYATRHPSLPNYLAMTGGSTFGITRNCTVCHVQEKNLVDQLEGAGISWRAYLESMPTPCFTGARFGRYAKKHNPFVYYDRITSDPERCAKVVPLSQLDGDIREGAFPSFAFVTPDLCSDMHDCAVSFGDAFLRTLMARLAPGLGSDGIVIITFDEDGTAGCCLLAAGGHIATVIAGPGAARGVEIAQPADHYSLLRLVEDNWGLPRLRAAACPCTPTLAGWAAAPPSAPSP